MFVVLIFLATVMALEGLYFLVADRRSSGKAQVQRRLQVLSGRLRAGELGAGSGELSILRGIQTGRRSLAEWVIRLLPNRAILELLLYRAGMPMTLQRLLMISALLGVGGWILVSALLNTPTLGLAGLALGLGPWIAVRMMARRRMREFELQFPEALELLTRALRAGHSLSTGFQLVGEEMADPVAVEFGLVAEEIKFGLDARTALVNLGQRVDNRDVPFFITAVLIQRETGGNLAELLDNLAGILRERAKFYGKLHAMTSQGRMTANVLALWPLVTIGAVLLTGSDYLDPLFSTPEGHVALIASAVLVGVGWFIARRLAEVEA
jgi:tight adherence protein B